jgi:hypothetical protein
MKAYAIVITFKDGNKEGVIFTNKDDALDALNGCEDGSTLAASWTDIYGDSECPVNMIEIDI